MRLHKYILPLLLISLGLASCNDPFMNRQPKTEIGKDNFFKTEEDLKMYTYGLYDFGASGMLSYDSGTDNQATTHNIEIKNIMTSTNPSSATISSGWDWERLYTINFFLDNAQEANVPDDIKAHYIGVARFFRAQFYMQKVKRYSNVPWYEHVISADDEQLLKKACDPRTFVIDKIFEDYAYAAEHVKSNKIPGAVNKWVVLTYMSRDALFEGSFRKYHSELSLQSTADKYFTIARDVAKNVIDNGGFTIYSKGDTENDYNNMFRSLDLTTNSEVILATYFDGKERLADTSEWNFGNYEPCPTKDMLQDYLMKDGSYYSSQKGYQTFSFVQEFQNRDPRLKQTYAYPGWELHQRNTYVTGNTLYVQQLNKNFTGYHLIKGLQNNNSRDIQAQRDYPVLRYAEVLLNYAEARAELGQFDAQDANIAINPLRRRVGMPDFNLNPTSDPVAVSKYGNISPLLQEIRRERRVELAFEGYRHDDLYRWAAGKVYERVPQGLYFPSLGKFDLTGDGIEDIYLIPSKDDIPADANKEVNKLGEKLVYYRTGPITDSRATVFLSEGTSGVIVTAETMGTFIAPQYYYRPIPATQMTLNPNLSPQPFGWK